LKALGWVLGIAVLLILVGLGVIGMIVINMIKYGG